MRLRKIVLTLGLLLTCGTLTAAEPLLQTGWGRKQECCVPCPPPASAVPYLTQPPTTATPGTPSAPGTPGSPAQSATQPPTTDMGAPERLGTGAVAQFTPTMFGDLLASQIIGPLTVSVNGVTQQLMRGSPIPPSVFVPGAVFNFDVVLDNGNIIPAGTPVPPGSRAPSAPLPQEPSRGPQPFSNGIFALIARGAFKVAENESPRPLDRLYVTYNFFYDVDQTHNTGPRTDEHRETLGVEKTFLDGNASLGLRLPFVQAIGDPSIAESGVGDLSIIGKYAFYNNLDTGSVFSGGMVLTVPTGDGFFPQFIPDVHPVLIQPWVGGIYQRGQWFTQGFSSIVIPTDSRDVTLLFNDLGFGYFLFQSVDSSDFVRYVAPVVETHITTPLNHRSSLNTPVGGVDIVTFTGGLSIGLGERSFLNIGSAVPVTGPRPYGFKTLVQFNWRY